MHTNKNHLISILFIVICSTGYLFDVLFLNKHLSAFDFALQQPSWAVEFGEIKAENGILSDSPAAHYPYRKEFWEAAKQGYNTQYLSHIFSGKPTVGQGVGIFSTSLFQLIMDIPNALDFSTWFRLILAGIFMYIFLFQLGLGSAAASLGAVAWAYNLHQISWLMFPQHLATQIWLPILLGLNIYLLKNKPNIAGILGLIITVVFFYTSGYTQIVLYTFVFLGVFNTVYLLIAQKSSALQRIKHWILIHAVYLSAGLLLLPDALWQAQEIKEGLRGTQAYRYNKFFLDVSITSIIALFKDFLPNSLDVVRFLMPNYHSDLGQVPDVGKLLKTTNSVEFQAYFGLVALFLSVYGLIRGLFAKDRLVIVISIMFFLCMALFNGNLLIIGLLNLIPFAGSGSFSRILTLLLFTAIILCAYGSKYIVEDLMAKRYWLLIAALALMVSWLLYARFIHQDVLESREFIPWFIYLGLFLALAVVLSRIGKEKFIIPLAVILTFAELTISGYSYNTRLDEQYHFPENTIIKKIRATEGDFRTALLMNHAGYQHNILSYFDLSTLGGYETTAPNDYSYFMGEAFEKVHLTANGIMFLFDGNLEILRLLNTHYVVSNLGLDSDLITEVYKNNAESLYRVNNPLDRVYCASDQIVNPDVFSIPRQLAQLAKTLDRPVVVKDGLMQAESLTENCQVSNLKVYSSKLEFAVETDQPTIVFIPTNYHQYWNANINDEKAEIHRANYSFMAIVVDAGNSQIKIEFINQKLTVAAILLIILGFVSIIVGLTRYSSGWQKSIFIVCGILLIGKNLMSIPGIMNTDIPEKPALIEKK